MLQANDAFRWLASLRLLDTSVESDLHSLSDRDVTDKVLERGCKTSAPFIKGKVLKGCYPGTQIILEGCICNLCIQA